MPSPYYCYNVTSEAGVWWVGLTPLGRSQAHGGFEAHTHTNTHKHTHTHTQDFHPEIHTPCAHSQTLFLFLTCVCVGVFKTIVNTHIRWSLLHRERNNHRGPCGKHGSDAPVTDVSRSAERWVEARGQVCRSQLAWRPNESYLPLRTADNATLCFSCCILIRNTAPRVEVGAVSCFENCRALKGFFLKMRNRGSQKEDEGRKLVFWRKRREKRLGA